MGKTLLKKEKIGGEGVIYLFLITLITPENFQKQISVVDSLFDYRYIIPDAFARSESTLLNLLKQDYKKDEVYWRLSVLYYKKAYELKDNKKLKMSLFQKGVAYGDSARKISPENLNGQFWYAANKGSIGKLKGVMNSLSMVGELKQIGNNIIKKDPNNIAARILLANIYLSLPGFMGGNADKSIELLQKGLEIDSCFTALYVPLANAYLKKKKKDKAKKVLSKLFSLKKYTHPGDYYTEDKPEGEELLKKIK